MTRSAGARRHGLRQARQVLERRRSAQCTSSTTSRQRPARARALHQLGHRLALAAAAPRVVHRVVERAQLERLRQIQEIVEVDPALVGEQPFGQRALDRRAGGFRVARALEPEQAAHQRADRVPPGAGAEVEHQAEVEGEALRPRPARRNSSTSEVLPMPASPRR